MRRSAASRMSLVDEVDGSASMATTQATPARSARRAKALRRAGTGEKLGDLEPFDAGQFLDALVARE